MSCRHSQNVPGQDITNQILPQPVLLKKVKNIWWQNGTKNIAVTHPGTRASRSGKMSCTQLAPCTGIIIRYNKLNSTTVGTAQESENHLVVTHPCTHASRSGN